jgi:replicative DNA helicase
MDTAFDLEVEQAVLGAFLIDDNATWSRIGDVFCPDPFYLGAHQAISAAIIARRAKAAPTDPAPRCTGCRAGVRRCAHRRRSEP